MRIIYTLVLTILLSNLVNGQGPTLGPLTSNPVLQLQHPENTTTDGPLASIRSGTDCLDPNPGIYAGGETALVTAGEQIIICPDLFQLDTAYCQSCNDFNFGQLDSTRNDCFYYSADIGVTFAIDTMTLSLCDSNNVCNDIDVFIVVKRAGQSFVEASTTIPELTFISLCATNVNLPGDVTDSQLIGCSDSLVGIANNGDPLNTCASYRSNRLAETDTVCLELCDQYCVCDTFSFPIRVVGDTLDLPFADDFSYGGTNVQEQLWLDNTVFVNNTLAYEPPSVGVATFDGLDVTGSPYGGGFGTADLLTSNYLDLEGQSGVILSFYLQSKGLGYPPTGGADITLEYKNIDGTWDRIKTVIDTFRVALEESPPFLYYEFPVDDVEYLYKGFQFRFRSQSLREGILDLWHLDYVRLDSDRTPGTQTIDDLAISTFEFSLLDRYTHMPIKQFLADPQKETVNDFDVLLYNHENEEQGVNDNTLVIKKSTEQQNILQSSIGINAQNVASLDYLQINNQIGFRSDLINELNNVLSSNDPVDLESTLAIRTDNQVMDFDLALTNDSISTITTLDNFYSYDDGTAELAISTTSPGYQLAVQYETNVIDSLRAVQFHFPHFNNDRGVRFNLFVWGPNLDDGPIYEQRFLEPLFTSEVFDTLQGFTTYAIKDANGVETPLPLPVGKFHIGWQQVSGNDAPVVLGFDRNTLKAAGLQFFNRNSWQALDSLDVIPGAVMMRPVLGSRSVFSTSTKDLTTHHEFPVAFPNPAQHLLRFSLPVNRQYHEYQLRVVDSTGRLVRQGVLGAELDLSPFENGLYFMELFHLETKERHFQKVMVLK